jgi:hypothetical protein
MDFSKFKAVDSANTRKAGVTTKEQTFQDLRYRRITKKNGSTEGRFYVSNARFDEWGLVGAKGLKQFTAPDGEMVLGVVAEKDATILKSKKDAEVKGRNFKAVRVEAALEKAGVIVTTIDESQYLKLTEVASSVTIDGIAVEKAYTLSKGDKKEKPVKAAPAEAPVAEATAEAAAPAVEAKKTDVNWD